MRLMAVSLTEQAVRDRTKTVTRRLGWKFAKAGDHIQLCRKVMGRKRPDGSVEPLDRIAVVELTNVFPVELGTITPADVAREGFPEMSPFEFVEMFCRQMRCTPETIVTRIEWRYLAPEEARSTDTSGRTALTATTDGPCIDASKETTDETPDQRKS